MKRGFSANRREAAHHISAILQEHHCCCYCREGPLLLQIGNRRILQSEGTAILIEKGEEVSLADGDGPFLLYIVPVPLRQHMKVSAEQAVGLPLFNLPFSIPDDRSFRNMFLDVLQGTQPLQLFVDSCQAMALMGMLMAYPAYPEEHLYVVLPTVKGRKGILAARFAMMVQEAEQVHNVSYYAGQLCVTEGYLAKCLKAACLPTPKKYIMAALLEKAIPLLAGGQHSITAISELLGFEGPSGFTSFFTSCTGLSPSAYRRMHL